MFAQPRSKRGFISSDDCFHGPLKLAHCGVLRDSIGKRRQTGPLLEAIFAGDDKLRVAQLKGGGPHIGYGLAAKRWVYPFEAPFRFFIT